MDIFERFMNIIRMLSLTETIAILTVLISALSVYYSSRAIRISLKTQKRVEKSEKLANSLKLKEKKAEGIRLLNNALIKLTQSKTYIELCQLSFKSFFDLSSKNISKSPNNTHEIEYDKSLKAINDIGKKVSAIELKIRDIHMRIKEEDDLLQIDDKLISADALDKDATRELQKIQEIHKDILEEQKTFRKVTFKKYGIDI